MDAVTFDKKMIEDLSIQRILCFSPITEKDQVSRRGSLFGTLQRLAREQARQQRQAEAFRQKQVREETRQQIQRQREQLRQKAQFDKFQRQQYLESRASEAEELTAEVIETMNQLRGILDAGFSAHHAIPFESLRINESLATFVVPPELGPGIAPKKATFLAQVRPMNFFEKLFSMRSRYQRDAQQAEAQFIEENSRFLHAENERQSKITLLRSEHEAANQKRQAEIQEHNLNVDQLKAAYESGEPSAVTAYCSMVLERSQYPQGFAQNFRLAYVPTSKELVVDYELPDSKIVPRASEFRYVKTKDVIEEKLRKISEIKEAYQDVVAGVALRTLRELLDADRCSHLFVVVFNGFVSAVDPATGHDIKPYLISVRTTKERFAELDLSRVEKKACLRNLGAQVSPQPTELQPVKPLVEFDMVDRRFVEGSDVLSELESRPNLMDLTPFEFEQLVGNLFAKMGLESKQTRASRDGGVDVVAYDTRPVIGGKVVIQAKRYRHTVGVSAVRDLFGTMNHEGANKGILVTTSSYGPDAYDFIKNKPIELVDGGGLLYYLEQHASVKARILFPVEE